ncbi:MAG TPA: hypothetical protein VF534_04740 [Paraburkholderia sp.]
MQEHAKADAAIKVLNTRPTVEVAAAPRAQGPLRLDLPRGLRSRATAGLPRLSINGGVTNHVKL